VRLVLACLAVVAIVVGVIRGSDAQPGPSHGVRLVYGIDLADAPDRAAALANAVDVIRERVDEKGLAVSVVAKDGERIEVELPTTDDETIARLQDVIARRATLELRVVDAGSQYTSAVVNRVVLEPDTAQASGITAGDDQWVPPIGSPVQDWYLRAEDREETVSAQEADRIRCSNPDHRCSVTGRRMLERYLETLVASDPAFVVPADREILYGYVEPTDGTRPFWRTYYVERVVRLDGRAVATASTSYDPAAGVPLVMVELNPAGAKVFEQLTTDQVGRKIAIVLDGKVKSAPIINAPVAGGRVQITMGGGTQAHQEREAMDLVAVLKTGSLPGPLMMLASVPFDRAGGGFLARSWMFFAAAVVILLGLGGFALRSRPR
jgi:preprotein translocase subunit SecD